MKMAWQRSPDGYAGTAFATHARESHDTAQLPLLLRPDGRHGRIRCAEGRRHRACVHGAGIVGGQALHLFAEGRPCQRPGRRLLYPSAYTAGCNIQAHEFSTKADRFAAAGASVIGVSLDSIERLNAFSADPDYCAGKLAVASDADGKIARAFGLKVSGPRRGATDTRGQEIDHGFTERTTFVVKRDGTVFATVGGVSPEDNVARALELVQKLSVAR